MKSLPVHQTSLSEGLRRTPEFEKKGLAQFSVNVGVKCGHGGTYCSSGSVLRCLSERMAAMRQAYELGLRVYGMLCPLLPGVAAGAEEIEELVAAAKPIARTQRIGDPSAGFLGRMTMTRTWWFGSPVAIIPVCGQTRQRSCKKPIAPLPWTGASRCRIIRCTPHTQTPRSRQVTQ